jgi:hypothetical protein
VERDDHRDAARDNERNAARDAAQDAETRDVVLDAVADLVEDAIKDHGSELDPARLRDILTRIAPLLSPASLAVVCARRIDALAREAQGAGVFWGLNAARQSTAQRFADDIAHALSRLIREERQQQPGAALDWFPQKPANA